MSYEGRKLTLDNPEFNNLVDNVKPIKVVINDKRPYDVKDWDEVLSYVLADLMEIDHSLKKHIGHGIDWIYEEKKQSVHDIVKIHNTEYYIKKSNSYREIFTKIKQILDEKNIDEERYVFYY